MMEFQQEVRLAMQVLLKVLRGSEDVDELTLFFLLEAWIARKSLVKRLRY